MSFKKLLGGFPPRFYVIALSGMLFNMGLMTSKPILTLHMQQVGASVFQIGSIFSIQALLLIFLRMPLTLLARRIGERKMMAVAFLAQSAAQLLYGMAQSPAWFVLISAVQIIASGSFFQLATSMNSNLAPPERQGDALGRHMTALSLPLFIGPAICSLLVNRIGYRGIFSVSFLFPLLGLVFFWTFTRGLDVGGSVLQSQETPSFKTLRKVFSSRNVVVLAFIRSLYSTSNNTFMTLFSLYAVNQLGFDSAVVAGLYSLIGVSNTLVKIPMGALSDRFGRRKVLLATYSLVVAAYFTLSRVQTYLPIAAAVIVFGVCWGTRATVEWAFMASVVDPDIKNIGISYMESFWDLGSMAGSFLAGYLSIFMPVPTIFLLLAVMNTPALPAINSIKEKINGVKRVEA